MLKLCKKCKKEFPRTNFYRLTGKQYKDSWDCRDSYCKGCRNGYQTERTRRLKVEAIEFLGGKCVDCGIIDIPAIYDFHHLDPTQKDFSIGKTRKSLEEVRKELEKCVLLCSNCHRKRHYNYF